MRYLFINSVCGIRSTGRICTDLAQQLETQGHECKIAYGRVEQVPEHLRKYAVRIGTQMDLRLHALQTRLFDTHGFGSKRATRRFLEWAEKYDPQVLWLHNLHGYYIHVGLLFEWIKSRPQMQVKWTLHDCWAFTGHCANFTSVRCNQWKIECLHCQQIKAYPSCFFKSSVRWNFGRKQQTFTGVSDMVLITPSQWLADLTRQSVLKEYPVYVVPNKIDTEIFRPMKSDFRERNKLKNKRIVLGVASTWSDQKGLWDFVALEKLLGTDFVIVLVGVSRKQQKRLPCTIKSIRRTNCTKELAQLYTVADVFVNPTYEDNYPTVNLEAQACGTPVITYDTGGSSETLYLPQSCAVQTGNLGQLAKMIAEVCSISG